MSTPKEGLDAQTAAGGIKATPKTDAIEAEWKAGRKITYADIFEIARQAEREAASRPHSALHGWQPIATAPEHQTVLTQHIDDICPQPAFKVDGTWMRDAEGPEDTMKGRPGKYGPLYRTPTHWMPLPPGPSEAPHETQGGAQDTARLDWWEANLNNYAIGYPNDDKSIWLYHNEDAKDVCGSTFREVVDNARAAASS